MREVNYTLGIDPSGAFDEGKGTTGWCIIDNSTKKILSVDAIYAKNYSEKHDYWEAHIKLISKMDSRYRYQLGVSIEDFLLYKQQAQSLVNSTFETVRVIAIITHHCYQYGIVYALRNAVTAKQRWTDDILLYKGIIYKRNGKLYAECRPDTPLCDHELDAIRHAEHFAHFENKAVIK